jgi:quercetin dioxygenase-like cupin family protein
LLSSVNEHGTITVTRYEMAAGDTVPEHTHPEGQGHVTIVAKGRARIAGPAIDVTLEAGQLIDFTPEQQTHGIYSLEDGTVVFNVYREVI